MKVCDEKIIKLKQRIQSELPVYSQDQIIRSREVRLESLQNRPHFSKEISLSKEPVFRSPLKDEVLRKVFKDQTERAILKSKQVSNLKMEKGANTGEKAGLEYLGQNKKEEAKQGGKGQEMGSENHIMKSNDDLGNRKVVKMQVSGEGERIVITRNLAQKEARIRQKKAEEQLQVNFIFENKF